MVVLKHTFLISNHEMALLHHHMERIMFRVQIMVEEVDNKYMFKLIQDKIVVLIIKKLILFYLFFPACILIMPVFCIL